ncbi:DUF6191 domain-containing protein [Actinoallomurus spadix]|uniref:Uncharacterized protein n=1 Tax=Actinoallomurus spadix TaxID=79912 RepID=A0ABN0W6J6_9ACTN|nr:DUF6191 domain-containing protein [Actinoallomurus spadix]MCO5986245.1 DUF6191 domain-containing protein [Actinoallomurus spadix]
MKSPFRRRPRRPRKRPAAAPEPEVIDWPKDGNGGGGGLMSAIRGDSSSGAGFGPGMFADLQAAFGGAGKQIQLEEQEKEKTRRHELHTNSAGGRDNLDSGTIRITKRRDPDDDEKK